MMSLCLEFILYKLQDFVNLPEIVYLDSKEFLYQFSIRESSDIKMHAFMLMQTNTMFQK